MAIAPLQIDAYSSLPVDDNVVRVRNDLHALARVTEMYIDPFNGGSTLTMVEIGELLRGIGGSKLPLASEDLRAWSGRETLLRVLGNLYGMWSRAGDTKKSAAARERMDLLSV